jgi:hypothetical protein
MMMAVTPIRITGKYRYISSGPYLLKFIQMKTPRRRRKKLENSANRIQPT